MQAVQTLSVDAESSDSETHLVLMNCGRSSSGTSSMVTLGGGGGGTSSNVDIMMRTTKAKARQELEIQKHRRGWVIYESPQAEMKYESSERPKFMLTALQVQQR